MQILCRKKIRRCLSSPLPRVASTCVLRFFFAEKVTNLRVSFMLIFALTYYRLVWTPTMLDELPLVQEIFSRRGWEAGNMLKHCGFWPLGSCIAGMSTSLASCRTCCQAASEFVRVKGIQRCLFCLRKSHFCWIKIFIDFIFVGMSRFFGEWIIMRLTLMGFSGNFVWPDAVLSLPWAVYGRGVWFKILVPRKLSAIQSFQHELSVEDLRFWPRLSQVGVEGRINRHGPGTHLLGCKTFFGDPFFGWTAELTQVAPEEKDGKGA